MNGIVINIDPVIFSLGRFQLRWYSLFVMLAIVAAVMITVRLAKNKGISPDHIYYGVPWAVLGGIVGARLFYVIDHGEHFLSNPAQILGGGGVAIYGALAGGVVASVVYARIRRIPLGPAADSLAPGLLVGQMIGRVGCIINGDVWGESLICPGLSSTLILMLCSRRSFSDSPPIPTPRMRSSGMPWLCWSSGSSGDA